MDSIEKKKILEDSFAKLRLKGVIKTYQDFARLLDVGKSSMSAAKNGNEVYLTDNLISKITTLMDAYEENWASAPVRKEVACPSIPELMTRVTELESLVASKEREAAWLRTLVEKFLT